MAQAKKWTWQWQVQGSAKLPYAVSYDGRDEWACSCPGWTQHTPRRDCKHIRQVQRERYQQTQEQLRRTARRYCVACGRGRPLTDYSGIGAGIETCNECLAAPPKQKQLSIRSIRKEGL